MELPVAAEIIPLSKLKNDLDFFTYRISEGIQAQILPGQIVLIPFRNKQVRGLVKSLLFEFPKTDFALKEILMIEDVTPLLDSWHIELIESLSRRYLLSMATIAMMIIPQIPKRKKKSNSKNGQTPPSDHNFSPTLSLGLSHQLISFRRPDTRLKAIKNLTYRALQDGQLLLVVPQVSDIEPLAAELLPFDQNLTVYSQEISIGKNWDNWQRIRSGESKIIIGTRSAIFAPFQNLSHIIIDQEEHELHKQDEPAPRYRVHTVAQMLATAHDATISYISETPSFEQLHRVAQKELNYVLFDQEAAFPSVYVVEVNKERYAGNFSSLGLSLQDGMRNADSRTLIVINKHGFAHGFYCRDCKTTTESSEPSFASLACKSCGGGNVFFVGKGVEGVAEELKGMFPEHLVRVQEKDASSETAAHIVIATLPSALSMNLQSFSHVAVLSFDQIEFIGDQFRAEKNFLEHMKLISRMNEGQEFYLHTTHGDSEMVQALSNHSYKSFYLTAHRARKDFHLPPFSFMVKLMYRASRQEDGEQELKKINAILRSLPSPVQAYPFQPMREFFRFKTYYWSTFIKIPDEKYLALIAPLRGMPIMIDTDPQAIF